MELIEVGKSLNEVPWNTVWRKKIMIGTTLICLTIWDITHVMNKYVHFWITVLDLHQIYIVL